MFVLCHLGEERAQVNNVVITMDTTASVGTAFGGAPISTDHSAAAATFLLINLS